MIPLPAWSDIQRAIHRRLWDTRIDELNFWPALRLRSLRVLAALIRDLREGELTLRAMSFVYTTLLSLVPLLALSFSILKAFGVHNQAEPLLQDLLKPLGDMAGTITEHIIGFVENMRVGVLGSIGLGLLVYTVLTLIRKIEFAFNFIWHISEHRSFTQRFSSYLSVVLIGPVLLFSALSIKASAVNNPFVRDIFGHALIEWSLSLTGALLPWVLIIAAYMFVFLFMPNTRVHWTAAAAGAVVAALLWQTAGWAFSSFVVASTKYVAIYSSFAIVILFLIWLYLNWLILLIGADIVYYCQYPEQCYPQPVMGRLSNRMREKLALLIMYHIGDRYRRGAQPLTNDKLVHAYRIPRNDVQVILDALESNGYLARTGESGSGYIPGRDPDTIRMADIIDVVRRAEAGTLLTTDHLPSEQPVNRILDRYEAAFRQSLNTLTLKQFISPDDAGQDHPDTTGGSQL